MRTLQTSVLHKVELKWFLLTVIELIHYTADGNDSAERNIRELVFQIHKLSQGKRL